MSDIYFNDFNDLDCVKKNSELLATRTWDNKPKYYKDSSDNYFKELVTNLENNYKKEVSEIFKDDFKLPYDVLDYHKALSVMDVYGCKVLTKSNLEELDELLSALDALIDDDTTKQVLENLKKRIL